MLLRGLLWFTILESGKFDVKTRLVTCRRVHPLIELCTIGSLIFIELGNKSLHQLSFIRLKG